MATHGGADPNFIDSGTDSSRALAHTNTIQHPCLQISLVYKGFDIWICCVCLNSNLPSVKRKLYACLPQIATIRETEYIYNVNIYNIAYIAFASNEPTTNYFSFLLLR